MRPEQTFNKTSNIYFFFKSNLRARMAVYAFNPHTKKTEAGRYL